MRYINEYNLAVLSSAVSLGSEGISAAELEARHLAAVTQAVAFLQARSPALPVHCEAELVDRLLATLIAGEDPPPPPGTAGAFFLFFSFTIKKVIGVTL